jgi:hypothetical protein
MVWRGTWLEAFAIPAGVPILMRLLPNFLKRTSAAEMTPNEVSLQQEEPVAPSESTEKARESSEAALPIKVGFVIGGVQKGGTTSLDAYLRQHPEVCMGQDKELHFFDEEENFRSTEVDYQKYHCRFAPGPNQHFLGDATPIYSYWEPAMRRIWEYNREMKVIILLRDPVQRAWSHWKMEHRRGLDEASFSVAIREGARRAERSLPNQDRVYSYVDRGFYSEQIRRIYRFFSPEQVLFLKSEDFSARSKEVAREVCRFLKVKEIDFDTSERHNTGDNSGEMPLADKKYLCDLYRYDVEQVKMLLGWECEDWLK